MVPWSPLVSMHLLRNVPQNGQNNTASCFALEFRCEKHTKTHGRFVNEVSNLGQDPNMAWKQLDYGMVISVFPQLRSRTPGMNRPSNGLCLR